MTHQLTIETADSCTADLIETRLLESLAKSQVQSTNTEFTLAAKDHNNALIGGLTASTSYGWLLIKVLWVEESLTQQGLGTALVVEAESRARSLGCHSVWLDTSNPEAMQFYSKLGFESFGELSNTELQHPPEHSRWFMKKEI